MIKKARIYTFNSEIGSDIQRHLPTLRLRVWWHYNYCKYKNIIIDRIGYRIHALLIRLAAFSFATHYKGLFTDKCDTLDVGELIRQ